MGLVIEETDVCAALREAALYNLRTLPKSGAFITLEVAPLGIVVFGSKTQGRELKEFWKIVSWQEVRCARPDILIKVIQHVDEVLYGSEAE